MQTTFAACHRYYPHKNRHGVKHGGRRSELFLSPESVGGVLVGGELDGLSANAGGILSKSMC